MNKFRLPLLLAVVAAVPVFSSADAVIEEIIARVNNSIITRADFDRSKEQLKEELKQQDPSNSNTFEGKEQDVLRDLIDRQLLLERGKELGITADTDLVKRLDEMRKQMNLDSMEDLEKAAQSQGVSFEDFKQNMRDQIITQQVIGREVGSHINITKDEEQHFYEAHKSEMQQPEAIRLNEILVAVKSSAPAPADPAAPPAAGGSPATPPPATTPPAPTEADISAAETKAKGLLDQIHKGAAFEDIAKKNSDGPSAAQGGDLGYFERGKLSKELEDKTFAMKAGEVTDVIRTKQGFVILKVTEHQMAGVPTVKQVEPKIMDALYYQKLQPALRTYLTKLREDAFIDIRTGYIDSGASPNQTKPIETTAKDAGAKNLKKKKKMGLF
jgi:peptidyl-prolyl cis-trans isomerase SurA